MSIFKENVLFTSDWHLGDDRLGLTPDKPNVFFRPFRSVEEQDDAILAAVNAQLTPRTTLIHLGDVALTPEGMAKLSRLKPCKKRILITGNYDEGKEIELGQYFDHVTAEMRSATDQDQGERVYANHYPLKCLPYTENGFRAITGHIHSAWKVQPNMVNVGIDAWAFRPVDGATLGQLFTAMRKHYDQQVFPYTFERQRRDI